MFGSKLILWGFFKKLVIADNLSPYVDLVFGDLHTYDGFALVLAGLFFTVQIYCDFSGYSDIARGVARLLDIDLMENFRSPYFSSSIREFWSRWHISLSTWFRDYVYIPLGGNRVTKIHHQLNLLVTFLVSGLWHGANWTFVIWGGIHGIGQIVENVIFPKRREKETKKGIVLLRTFFVFTFVSMAWVFFRAQSFNDAVYVFANLLNGITRPIYYLWNGFAQINFGKLKLIVYTILLFVPLLTYDFIQYRTNAEGSEYIAEKGKIVSWIFWIAIGCIIVFYAPKDTPAEFVYFQF